MDKISVNGYNYEKSRLWNLFENRIIKMSKIQKYMRISWFEFQSIVFHPGFGAEALVRDVRDAVPYENGGIGGGGWAPIIENNCDELFS